MLKTASGVVKNPKTQFVSWQRLSTLDAPLTMSFLMCGRRFIEEQSVKWREEMDHLKECWATELRSLNSRWLKHWEQLK